MLPFSGFSWEARTSLLIRKSLADKDTKLSLKVCSPIRQRASIPSSVVVVNTCKSSSFGVVFGVPEEVFPVVIRRSSKSDRSTLSKLLERSFSNSIFPHFIHLDCFLSPIKFSFRTGAIAWAVVGMVLDSFTTVPQTEHLSIAVFPGVLQVGYTPPITSMVCSFFSMVLRDLKTRPHWSQYRRAVFPVSVQVGSIAGLSAEWWPVAGISICSFRISPQVSQWLPAVFPAIVQVAAISLSAVSLWPVAGISTCADNIFPQRAQWLPSVFPESVQVAATPSSIITSLWS